MDDMNLIQIEKKGYRFTIQQDQDPESSRNWDNLGIMCCFHNGYNLGDKNSLNSDSFNSMEELEEYLIKEEDALIIIPLYLFDHSGISINTRGFSCGWDSGQIGFIYTTKKRIKEFLEVKKITKKILKSITENLISEVKVYDQYLKGEVYNFYLEKKKKCSHCESIEYKQIDSCCGFYMEDSKENFLNNIFNHIGKKYKFLKEEALKEL